MKENIEFSPKEGSGRKGSYQKKDRKVFGDLDTQEENQRSKSREKQ